MELAILLSKLEGSDDPTKNVVGTNDGDGDATIMSKEGTGGNDLVHYLSMASASDFGHSNNSDEHHDNDHLHHDEDDGGMQNKHLMATRESNNSAYCPGIGTYITDFGSGIM